MSLELARQIMAVFSIGVVMIVALLTIDKRSDAAKDDMVGWFLGFLAVGPVLVIGSIVIYAAYVCATGNAS